MWFLLFFTFSLDLRETIRVPVKVHRLLRVTPVQRRGLRSIGIPMLKNVLTNSAEEISRLKSKWIKRTIFDSCKIDWSTITYFVRRMRTRELHRLTKNSVTYLRKNFESISKNLKQFMDGFPTPEPVLIVRTRVGRGTDPVPPRQTFSRRRVLYARNKGFSVT